MNKRVLITCGTLERGGAERVISILSHYLSHNGYDVIILLYYKSKIQYRIDPNVKVVFEEDYIHKPNVLQHVLWRKKYFKTVNPHCVISFLAPFNMISIIANLGLKIPLIVADRNDPRRVPTNQFKRALRDFLYHFADRIVLQNYDNLRYFSKIIQSKSVVIENPVDVSRFAGAAIHSVRASNTIIWAARLMPQKNPMLIINAMEEVHQLYPEMDLYMYGDGPMKEHLVNYIDDHFLGDFIHVMGAVDNIYECMTKACLYVLSSDYEGMPNTLIEAMCIGLPVISTRVSGARELIETKKNGVLVDCNDVRALSNAIVQMLSSRDNMIKIANENIKLANRLSADKISEKWISLIENIYHQNSVLENSEG